jgi:ferredoxin--NADP+ reductase
VNHFSRETVIAVRHWNENLFSFTTTRDRGLRFKNGHFLMLGLEVHGRPLLRAYSVASPNHEEHLEFYSIKVPGGALTSRLRKVEPGDAVLVSKKPTGTLVLNTLLPGKRLYLLATGTGLAPFMSLIRDPETYERFEQVTLAHSVRRRSDLGYAEYIRHELPRHEYLGEHVQHRLRYYPTVTREPFEHCGRLTELVGSGRLFHELGLPPLDAEHDRVMICGNPGMLAEMVAIVEGRRFRQGLGHEPGHYAIERAFVER